MISLFSFLEPFSRRWISFYRIWSESGGVGTSLWILRDRRLKVKLMLMETLMQRETAYQAPEADLAVEDFCEGVFDFEAY